MDILEQRFTQTISFRMTHFKVYTDGRKNKRIQIPSKQLWPSKFQILWREDCFYSLIRWILNICYNPMNLYRIIKALRTWLLWYYLWHWSSSTVCKSEFTFVLFFTHFFLSASKLKQRGRTPKRGRKFLNFTDRQKLLIMK